MSRTGVLRGTIFAATIIAALLGWWIMTLVGVVVMLVLWRVYAIVLAGLILDVTYAPALHGWLVGEYPFTLLCVVLGTGVYLLRHQFVAPHVGPAE